MRIDPKYFNKFVLVAAIAAAALIAYFTIFNKMSREKDFRRTVQQADSLRYRPLPVVFNPDTVHLVDFEGNYVVLTFWASWAPNINEEHKYLAGLKETYGDRLEVVAAAVEDTKEDLRSYMRGYDYPFTFVEGNKLFQDLHVPGLPSQIVFRPDGSILFMNVGFPESTVYLPLEHALKNGRDAQD